MSPTTLPSPTGYGARWYPWLYLLGIGTAEALIAYGAAWPGTVLHLALALLLVVQSAQAEDAREKRFCLALVLAPLIRLSGLAISTDGLRPVYQYLVLSIPLFAAAAMVVRFNGYRRGDIRLRPGLWYQQLPIALAGIPMGLGEYWLLHPASLVPAARPVNLILPALILLVSTGFLEELVFRGIIQTGAEGLLGEGWATMFVSWLYTAMTIPQMSGPHLLLVLVASMVFTSLVVRTKSLTGVILAHGLSNVVLYLVAPLFFH